MHDTGGITLALFGNRLRDLRRSQGISQEALADAAGLDRSYVGQVERGERNVALINITRLASALGVEASELLVGIGPLAAP